MVALFRKSGDFPRGSCNQRASYRIRCQVPHLLYKNSWNLIIMDFGNVPDSQKGELMRYAEEVMLREGHRSLNHLLVHCFDKCVMTEWGGGFSSKQLTDTESKCISSCADKYSKLAARVGFRLGETMQAQAAQQQQQQVRK